MLKILLYIEIKKVTIHLQKFNIKNLLRINYLRCNMNN